MNTMIHQDVFRFLEIQAPPDTAAEWDNVGLMIGNRKDSTSSIVLSLDADDKSLAKCRETGANLLITHHPMIFHPLREIDYQTPAGRRFRDFICEGITVYSAHTNLDKAEIGVNKALAEAVGLQEHKILEGAIYGRVGDVEAISLSDFAKRIADTLGAGAIQTVGEEDPYVRRVFVCGGSLDSSLFTALYSGGIDTVVTGEAGYHDMLDLLDHGIRVLAVGHDVSERVVLEPLAQILRDNFPGLGVAVAKGFVYNGNVF